MSEEPANALHFKISIVGDEGIGVEILGLFLMNISVIFSIKDKYTRK